jgi:protein-tyrosine phosphatase
MQTSDNRHVDIENFAWMSPWLARGGQPDENGFRELDRAGVTFIVNLRERDESAEVYRSTRRAKPVHVPVKNDYAPTEEQALRWLDFCAQRASADKFYVHCHAGHGRTSTFCILVRLAQGHALEQSVIEEQRCGFDPEGKHRRQYDFLRSFEERIRSGAVDAPSLADY